MRVLKEFKSSGTCLCDPFLPLLRPMHIDPLIRPFIATCIAVAFRQFLPVEPWRYEDLDKVMDVGRLEKEENLRRDYLAHIAEKDRAYTAEEVKSIIFNKMQLEVESTAIQAVWSALSTKHRVSELGFKF